MGFTTHISNGLRTIFKLRNKKRQQFIGQWIVSVYTRALVVRYEDRTDAGVKVKEVYRGNLADGVNYLKGRYDERQEESAD